MSKPLGIMSLFSGDDQTEIRRLYRETAHNGLFAAQCCERFVRPNIQMINSRLGQDMHDKYVAYMIQHDLMLEKRGVT